MEDLNVLLIAGNWTDDGGRESQYINKIINTFENKLGHPIRAFNGGNVKDLPKILAENSKEAQIIFWSPNIPPDAGVRLNPKNYNYRAVLVTFKRNDHQRRTFDEMLSRAILNKSDLVCEILRNDSGKYEMKVYDSLGTLWSDYTTNTARSISTLLSRARSILSFKYYRTYNIDRHPIQISKEDFESVHQLYYDFGEKLKEVQEADASRVRRNLGEISFRASTKAGSQMNDIIYANVRNIALREYQPDDFVATKFLGNRLNYYGLDKPHFESGVFDQLMMRLPDLKYILHSHCYISDAPFTDRCLCPGCVQEYEEICRVIDSRSYTDEFCINLLGHGSIMASSNQEYLYEKFGQLVKRELPETVGVDYDVVEVNDGVTSFINVLNNKQLEPDEKVEVMFPDGSIGSYNVEIKYYKDDQGLVHKSAYVEESIRGIDTELPITGLLARRI